MQRPMSLSVVVRPSRPHHQSSTTSHILDVNAIQNCRKSSSRRQHRHCDRNSNNPRRSSTFSILWCNDKLDVLAGRMTTLLFVTALLVIVVVPAFAMAEDSIVAASRSVPDRLADDGATEKKKGNKDDGGTASHRGVASAIPVGGGGEGGTSEQKQVGGLKWVNLSVSIQRRRGVRQGEKQYLLSPSRGFIPNGSVCGVIGPSGAGKSTLLSALGGTTPRTAGVRLTGSVWLEEWEDADDDDEEGKGGEEGDGGSGGAAAATGDGANAKKKKRKASYLSTTDGEVALLQQDDAFFSMLTPRETIELAAFLQLPPPSHIDDEGGVDEQKEEEGWDIADRQRKEAEPGPRRRKPRPRRPTAGRSRRHDGTVDKILDSLGLKTHQHRRIGDRHVGGHGRGGLSGGERRRLSVGVELVTAPKVFLADEATTGLDSTQAERVVALMRNLAHERDIPCICTLHQPRASIWKKLDSVILMAPGGRICYMGDRVGAVEYFTALGYPCPSETNPAEFMIDLVSVDTEDQDQALLDLERIDYLGKCFADSNALRTVMKGGRNVLGEEGEWTPPSARTALWMNDNVAASLETIRGNVARGGGRRKKVNFLKRFGVLLRRAWRQNVRDRRLNLFRLVASVGQAFLFSQIFRSVTPGPPTAKSIADRTALLSFGVINMSMLALMKTLTLFGKEKAVVTRERMRKQYSGFEYLLSKMLAEFPLDALFSSAFASVLKRTTGLQCSRWVLCGTYSLMTVAGASLGFAIGSLTSNPDAAMAAGMPIMVVLMIVGIINPSGADAEHPAPSYIEWIKVASPIKWAIEALATAEYRGMVFAKRKKWAILRLIEDGPRMGGLSLVKNGDQVLDALGLSDASYPDLMKKLGKLVGVYLLVSLFGLTFCGPTFVQARGEGIMEDELDDTDGGVAMDDMMAEIGELRMKNAPSKPFVVEPHNIPTVRRI